MGLQIERIPTFGDNYTYLVICDETSEAAVIDAPEEAPVVARVEATGATVASGLGAELTGATRATNAGGRNREI